MHQGMLISTQLEFVITCHLADLQLVRLGLGPGGMSLRG